MGIVTVPELKSYMSSIQLRTDQWEAAEDVLAGVQGELETFLNRSLEPAVRTEYLVVDHAGNIWPLHTPVLEVVSVTHAGAPLPYTFDGAAGLLSGGATGQSVIVTYRGGIGTDHRAFHHLKLEVMRIAAREMQNRHDDVLSVKDLETTDTPPAPIGLTEEDKQRVRRWKRRVVA